MPLRRRCKQRVMATIRVPVAEGSAIQDAIDAITDNGAARRYIIRVGAGTFSEVVTLKPYVSLQGVGPTTVITAAGGVNGTIKLANNTAVRNMTVVSTGALGIAIVDPASTGGAWSELSNLVITASGAVFKSQRTAHYRMTNLTCTSAGDTVLSYPGIELSGAYTIAHVNNVSVVCTPTAGKNYTALFRVYSSSALTPCALYGTGLTLTLETCTRDNNTTLLLNHDAIVNITGLTATGTLVTDANTLYGVQSDGATTLHDSTVAATVTGTGTPYDLSNSGAGVLTAIDCTFTTTNGTITVVSSGTPTITSVTLPTIPGTGLLEGEPFWIVGTEYDGTDSTVYWASTAVYATATKTECTVTAGTATLLTATMCDPAAVGNTGYIFVVCNGVASPASTVQHCIPALMQLTMEAAATQWAGVTPVGDGSLTYHADAKYAGSLGALVAVTTENDKAYGANTLSSMGEFYMRFYLRVAALTLGDGASINMASTSTGGIQGISLKASGADTPTLDVWWYNGTSYHQVSDTFALSAWYIVHLYYNRATPVAQAWLQPVAGAAVRFGNNAIAPTAIADMKLGVYGALGADRSTTLHMDNVFAFGA